MYYVVSLWGLHTRYVVGFVTRAADGRDGRILWTICRVILVSLL